MIDHARHPSARHLGLFPAAQAAAARERHPRWDRLGDSQVVTSTICEAEVLFGIAKKGSSRLATAFSANLRSRLAILPLDSACAAAYADLRAACELSGSPVADMDLLIAATAKANNLIVATLNKNDFHAIQGISKEDWSKP